MNFGITKLAWRDTWPMTLFFCVGVGVFHILLAAILPTFQKDVTDIISRLKFVQQILAALLGTDAETAIGPAAISVMPWAHPIVLALVWAHAIMQFTRYPAGEIDRGTIDWTLALPARRSAAFLTHSLVSLGSGVLLILAGFAGNLVGGLITEPVDGPSISVRIMINTNLILLYLAVGALAALFSSMSDRRARASGAAFAVVMTSFLINSLATFNTAIKQADFAGIMSYYRPIKIMTADAWPTRDLLILAMVSIVCWTAAALIFSRRDIHTV